MDDLLRLKHRLNTERPAKWTELPDIELYKDQILNYMTRQHTLQRSDEQLTGAMINNYIKSGMLPRASKKKYSKEHAAYLTAICLLKQVLTVNDTSFLIKQQLKDSDVLAFYEEYRTLLDKALFSTAAELDDSITEDELAHTALRLAVSSYAQKLTCEHILDILRAKADAKNALKEDTKKSEKEEAKKKPKE